MELRKIRLELELNPGSDKVYTITSPDVPGLVTEGSTLEEILHNVQEALEVLFEGWAELGKQSPPALRQPDPIQSAEFLLDQEALERELATWDVLSDEALAEFEQTLQDPSAIMGKYHFVPTSSEDFARRKQEEIELED